MIEELKDRTNPQSCLHCGCEQESINIEVLIYASGRTEKSTTVRCIRCQNVKFGRIKPQQRLLAYENQ